MTRLVSARRAIDLTMLWVGVGIASAAQLYLAALVRGEPASFWLLTVAQVRNALPWIPVTVFVFRAVRTTPITRKTWRRVGLFYLIGGVGLVWCINISQVALRVAAEGRVPGSGFWPTVVQGTFAWGHIAFIVLMIIAGIAHARYRSPQSQPPSTESDLVPSKPLDTVAYAKTVNAKDGRATIVLRVEDIDWLEAAGDYVRVHVGDSAVWLHKRMAELERMLDPAQFARVHRSAIVNIEGVRIYKPISHGDYELVLRNGARVKVSRSRRDALKRIKQATNGLHHHSNT